MADLCVESDVDADALTARAHVCTAADVYTHTICIRTEGNERRTYPFNDPGAERNAHRRGLAASAEDSPSRYL